MGYWTRDDLPFYHDLAATFPLVDRWFCDLLGPTNPNRRYLISGTSHGLIDDEPLSMLDRPPAGTIFDLLTANGVSWADYHSSKRTVTVLEHLLGARVRSLRHLPRLARTVAAGGGLDELEQKAQFTADVYPLRVSRYLSHVRGMDDFFRDAAAGTLPSVAIVDPDFDTNSEENPQDIRHGELFSYRVIRAVMDGPGWDSTVLVWLYDEHGGYYDHVPPPPAVPPDDVQARSLLHSPVLRLLLGHTNFYRSLERADAGPRSFDRYGFRVPAVVVSPWARRGWVASEAGDAIFDHTSVLRLIEERWNLPAMTRRDLAARDRGHGSILDALDLTEQAFATPPDLAPPRLLQESGGPSGGEAGRVTGSG